MESSSLATLKAELRSTALTRRDALPAEARQHAAEAIAARGFPVPLPDGAIVSGFFPLKSEINPVPLMKTLSEAGARLALPVVMGRGNPLTFRAWTFGDPLKAGVWGIREPVDEAPAVDPDILIVPLACFDRRGYRIGYGAAYYDMSLNALRAKKTIVAVGIAFAAQEVAEVPVEPHDARLDYVVTERDVIDCRNAG